MHEPVPIALTIRSACEISGLGRSTLYEAIKARRLTVKKCGNRTLVLHDDLKAFITGLPTLAA